MKIQPYLLTLLFTFLYLNVSAQKGKDVVFPTTPFDKTLSENALATGNSTLRGFIQKKAEDPDNTLMGIEVELFPYTPYISEWVELRRNNKKGKKNIVILPEAYSYRIMAKASDGGGTFEYKNLKPGKYFLQAKVTQGKSKKISTKVGDKTTTGYNVYGNIVYQSTIPVYELQRVGYDVTEIVTTIVEITSDGQTVYFKL